MRETFDSLLGTPEGRLDPATMIEHDTDRTGRQRGVSQCRPTVRGGHAEEDRLEARDNKIWITRSGGATCEPETPLSLPLLVVWRST
jgi:hypothetical protein